jgi:TonB family protein
VEADDLVVDLGSSRGAVHNDVVETWRPLRLKHPVTALTRSPPTERRTRGANRGLRDDATQRGRIVVRVHVAPGGEVDKLEVVSNVGLSEAVAQCVAAAARTASFPPPCGVGSTINIPFNFKPADHGE